MSKRKRKPKLSRAQAAKLRRLHKDVKKLEQSSSKLAKQTIKNYRAQEKDILKQAKAAQRAAEKAVRHEWAILRRKGLVKTKTKDLPINARTKAVIEKYRYVITGDERTFKVTKAQAAALKKQGVEIRNGRAVVAKTRYVRNGKVFNQASKSEVSTLTVQPGETLMEAIEKAFRKFKPKHGLAFRFKGFRSFQVYHSPISVYDTLIEYSPDEQFIIDNVEFYDPKMSAEKFQRHRTIEQVEREENRVRRRRERRRAARQFPGPNAKGQGRQSTRQAYGGKLTSDLMEQGPGGVASEFDEGK